MLEWLVGDYPACPVGPGGKVLGTHLTGTLVLRTFSVKSLRSSCILLHSPVLPLPLSTDADLQAVEGLVPLPDHLLQVLHAHIHLGHGAVEIQGLLNCG